MNGVTDKRIIAFLIDHVVAAGISAIAGFIGVLFTDAPEIYILFMPVWVFLLYGLKDIFDGQSLGKRIIGLKVVCKNGDAASKSKLIVRNLTLYIWPIEAVLIMINKERLGDTLAKTKVVEAANNLKPFNLRNST